MSYFVTTAYTLVVCDACQACGPAGHYDWRHVRRELPGKPIHLCQYCRGTAVWCDLHNRYHLPDDHHRIACIDCGGLFTAIVRANIRHCPGCRRAHATGPIFVPQPQRHRRPAHTLLQRLRAFLALR